MERLLLTKTVLGSSVSLFCLFYFTDAMHVSIIMATLIDEQSVAEIIYAFFLERML